MPRIRSTNSGGGDDYGVSKIELCTLVARVGGHRIPSLKNLPGSFSIYTQKPLLTIQ